MTMGDPPHTFPVTLEGVKPGEMTFITAKRGVGISTYLNGHQPHELARLAEPYPNQHTHELSIAELPSQDPFALLPGTLPGRVVNVAKPKPPADEYHGDEREYRAEYGNSGEAFLVLTSKAVLAKFDTFADAQTAAEALNNHKGY